MTCSFDEFVPGTNFALGAGNGFVHLTVLGRGRKWLDVSLNGAPAVLLCYYDPFNGDFDGFRRNLQLRGGAVEAAALEIREGMTALIMQDGNNYPFSVESVSIF